MEIIFFQGGGGGGGGGGLGDKNRLKSQRKKSVIKKFKAD